MVKRKTFSILLVVLVFLVSAVFGTRLLVGASGGELVFLPLLARSATCNVPSGNYPTIQSAVDINCPTINLAAGTYFENVELVNRTVRIVGQAAANTIVDGGDSGSVFTVSDDSSLTLENLTVANGEADEGAGIHNSGFTRLDNSVVRDNETTFWGGGGIFTQGDLFVNNSLIVDNVANITGSGYGGAIQGVGFITIHITDTIMTGNHAHKGGALMFEGSPGSFPNVMIVSSDISNNQAAFGGGLLTTSDTRVLLVNVAVQGNIAGASGGGILNGGEMRIVSGLISDNSAATNPGSFCGGGILNSWNGYSSTDEGEMRIEWSEIRGNSSGGGGGGICNLGDEPVLEVYNSLIMNNTAMGDSFNMGGGVRSSISLSGVAPVRFENVTIYGNSAEYKGGGISADNLQLVHVTLSGNTAPEGAGLMSTGVISYVNSIIAGNLGSSDCAADNLGTGLNSMGYNIASDNSCDLDGPKDMPNTNPLLGPLQNNGGPTWTMALLVGSPAIDLAFGGVCVLTDQRGVTRPQGPDCDIGAFEKVQSIIYEGRE